MVATERNASGVRRHGALCAVVVAAPAAAPYIGGMTAPVLTRADVLERLRTAEAEIRRRGVRRLALFGSFVRDEARPDSDVDLYVEFVPGQKSFDRFMRLADELEGLLGRAVELVTPEALSPFIGPHILAEAEDVLRAA